ncbi:MAG: hypothetical protein UFD57_01530, partial [Collinsella sp.]|nr:hypothetical protein [Collinsella sp.]
PEPLGPATRMSLAGAPIPEFKLSVNSRAISSRPIMRGGSAPAVGRNGLWNIVALTCLPLKEIDYRSILALLVYRNYIGLYRVE